MSTNSAFARRFNQALDEMPGSSRPPPKGSGRQQAVARMFQVSQKGARKWLEGEAIPRTHRLETMARRIGVRGEWLLTGQGPMKPDGDLQIPAVAERRSKYRAIDSRLENLIQRLKDAAADGHLTESDIAELEGALLYLVGRRTRR